MKIFTEKELIKFCRAIVDLERAGKKFCVDYGYNNAVKEAAKLSQGGGNVRPCHCCGQDRLYPMEVGEWEYCEFPTTSNEPWIRVSIRKPLPDDRDGQEGLRLWRNGEMIWWPSPCAWRKYEQT